MQDKIFIGGSAPLKELAKSTGVAGVLPDFRQGNSRFAPEAFRAMQSFNSRPDSQRCLARMPTPGEICLLVDSYKVSV